MTTRYELHRAARWIPRVFIDYVVKAMHEIVIRDMQSQLAQPPRQFAEAVGSNRIAAIAARQPVRNSG